MSLKLWSKRAQRGEALLYHTGLLMRDRLTNPDLDAIASFFWSIGARGVVSLVQHKSKEFEYEYLAIKN